MGGEGEDGKMVIVGWVENQQISTVMGLMGYLNSDFLHRLHQI